MDLPFPVAIIFRLISYKTTRPEGFTLFHRQDGKVAGSAADIDNPVACFQSQSRIAFRFHR